MVARQRLDLPGAITGISKRLRAAESRASLGFSSITRGGMRVESAEGIRVNTVPGGAPGLRVTGLELVDGTLRVTGILEGVGTFVWSGPWDLAGNGKITGNVDLIGILKAGNVRIEDGKIYIGTMVLDPTNHSGMITMPNDGQVLATGSNLELYGPNSAGGRNGIRILPDHVSIAKIPVKDDLEGLFWLGTDVTGKVWKVSQNTGGPMGALVWPFPASLVTSEFGPRDGGFHEGIDFGLGIANIEGTPIPAAGSGTVIESVTGHPGWGNYVKIRHSASLETLSAHMYAAPIVSVGNTVARGQTLGGIGNTGASDGNHLHFEVYFNGVAVNPRSKLPTP